MKSFNIGNIKIKNQVVIAPMAGISSSSFRKIAKSFGAGLIYCEMVSDKAIVYGNEKTLDLLKMDEIERPISQQIFGSDVNSFVESAIKIEQTMHPDIIDINMGCPVPKVATRAQAGSALLKNPQKIYDIVSNVVKNVSVPVTVKIRSGWDENSINAVEVAKICEKAGASAIAVHPRTRKQGYSGNADWTIIKKVKENVKIPVIGNGDIKSVTDAKKMLDETSCDAIMVGRAVLGNPWLIKDIINYLESGTKPSVINKKEKLDMLLKHYNLLKTDKCEKVALMEIKTLAMYYLKGLEGSTEVKQKICSIKTEDEFLNIVNNYLIY